jgi:hypothetical protein
MSVFSLILISLDFLLFYFCHNTLIHKKKSIHNYLLVRFYFIFSLCFIVHNKAEVEKNEF